MPHSAVARSPCACGGNRDGHPRLPRSLRTSAGHAAGRRILPLTSRDACLRLSAHGRNQHGPVGGYRFASWEKGYGDFELAPDWSTLRAAAWLDKNRIAALRCRNEEWPPARKCRPTVHPAPADPARRRRGLPGHGRLRAGILRLPQFLPRHAECRLVAARISRLAHRELTHPARHAARAAARGRPPLSAPVRHCARIHQRRVGPWPARAEPSLCQRPGDV